MTSRMLYENGRLRFKGKKVVSVWIPCVYDCTPGHDQVGLPRSPSSEIKPAEVAGRSNERAAIWHPGVIVCRLEKGY